MMNKNFKIAIIPARVGSIRLPNKNIKILYGKPAIAWTILKLKKCKIFNEIYVSTDSKKIASISNKYGAKVPFFRNKKLSNNKTNTQEVVVDMLKYLKKKKIKMDSVCCVYPTAFNLNIKDIKKAYKKLNSSSKFVFVASKFNKLPQRGFYIDKKCKIKMMMPNFFKYRTQDLKPVYFDVGQFYWAKTNHWIKNKLKFDSSCTTVSIPNWRAQDIDTLEDWIKAKEIFRKLRRK